MACAMKVMPDSVHHSGQHALEALPGPKNFNYTITCVCVFLYNHIVAVHFFGLGQFRNLHCGLNA